MASEKISAMTPATEVLNADLIPIVQALTNYKATRQQLLTAGTGEDIILDGENGGHVRCTASGDIELLFAAAEAFTIADTLAHVVLDIAGTGQITLTGYPGQDLVFQLGAVAIRFAGGGGLFLQDMGGGSINVQYTPANVLNWAGAPNRMADALDRLAAAVVALQGGAPIA